MNQSASDLWRFLPFGYALTILIETPILVLGLSKQHSIRRRLLAGVWLTACTYPIVVLVLPVLLQNSSRAIYLIVAETFAPVAECILFWLAYGKSPEIERDRCGRTSQLSWSLTLPRFWVEKL